MNSVLAAMEFVIFTVKNRGGNPGNWHAFSGPTVDNYAKELKKHKTVYSDKFKKNEL